MRKKIMSLVLFGTMLISLVVLSGCDKNDKKESKQITVSIAASLQKPMDKIKEEFKKETGIDVNYNIGGSGTLKKQISQGADVDIFFSANTKYANELVKEGLVNKDKLKLWDDLKGKFVYAKSVNNVVNYVDSGDAAYGFVYKTDAMKAKDSKIVYEVPNKYHKKIEYVLCLLKNTKNKEESEKFVDFLKVDKSKKIFKEYGFGVE